MTKQYYIGLLYNVVLRVQGFSCYLDCIAIYAILSLAPGLLGLDYSFRLVHKLIP